ncbi:O-antigen ligase family protein [Actinomadura sp. NPDC047616]|uniref:O-antigen ligase family protein n=1 Tax=Actinomadura sp. NPDC047616 TaxID=3155914 RepID=UPI0033E9A97F
MKLAKVSVLPRRQQRTVVPSAGWWVVVLPLALMLSSDYKLRSREVDQAVSGSADLTVLVEIAMYGCAALYLHHRFRLRPPARRPTGLLLAAWAFAVYVALTALWSPYPQLGVVRGAQLLITMTVIYTVATRAQPRDLHRLAHAFIAIVLVSVAIGVVHPFPRTSRTQERFNWLFVHPVIAGVYLAVAVLLVISYLVRREHPEHRLWHPVVYMGALAVLSGALVATGTRGAALGCAAGLVVLLATARGPHGRADVIVLGAAVAVLAALAFSDAIMAFVARGETADKLLSLNSRTDLWELAMRAYAEEPVFGRGLGASRGLFLDDIGLGGGHNAFINALVDNGAVGAAIFAALLVALCFVLLLLCRHRPLRPDAGLLLGLLGFFVVDSMTTEGLATPANVSGIWLLIMVAWTETLRRQSRVLDAPPPAVDAASPTADAAPAVAAEPERATVAS